MKNKFLILLLLMNGYAMHSQIVPIPDANFKAKLLQSSTTNNIAYNNLVGNIKIDTNNNNEIEISEALQVNNLFVTSSNIANLSGIEYFTNLVVLNFAANVVTTANLSNLTQLQGLGCHSNHLTSLNLSGLTNLISMGCFNNQLTSIDLSSCVNLEAFNCSNNNFTSLDFSSNHSLTILTCSNNPSLTTIKIRNNIAQDFNFIANYDCWTNGSPNLNYICADDFEIADLQNYLAGCGATQTITIDSLCPLATDDFASSTIKLFPNPTNSIITITGEVEIKNIELYDIQGRLLLSKDVNDTSSILDISDKSKGVYLLKVIGATGYVVEKVVKE